MQFRIRDALWTMIVVAMSLAWFGYARQQAEFAHIFEQRVNEADARAKNAESENKRWVGRAASMKLVGQELDEEVRRLRGVIKGSLADQREWFELEVSGKRLVGVRLATVDSPLRTIEEIEATTGLDAKRLKHFLTPISELQLDAVSKQRTPFQP